MGINMIKKKALALKKKAMGVIGKVKNAVNKGKKKLKSAAGKAKGKSKLSFSKLAKMKKSEETSLEDLDDLDLDLDQQGYGNPINMIKKKALALKKKAMGVIGKLKKKA